MNSKSNGDRVPLNSLVMRGLGVIGSLKLAVILMALLILLVFLGTLYQVENGVYQAQEVFFFSWLTIGWTLPLPGGQLLLWLIAANLIASLITRLPRIRPRFGLIIAHGGLIVLLLGAFSGLYSSDSFIMALQEGGTEDRAYHRSDWDLVVYQLPGAVPLSRIEISRLRAGAGVEVDLPDGGRLVFQIENNYRNSAPSEFGGLIERPLENEVIRNYPGIEGLLTYSAAEDSDNPLVQERFVLHGGDQNLWLITYLDSDGRVVPDLGDPPAAEQDGLALFLEPRSIQLPFSVTLDDFEALFHPGTDIPASFESHLQIQDREPDGLGFSTRISMNNPLRIQGFTMYQSSYRQADPAIGIPRDLSVLAVRRDGTAWLPYAGTLVSVFGLIIHLFQRRRGGRRVRIPQKKKRTSLLLILVVLFMAEGLYGQDHPNVEGLVIQSDGRTMPVQTYAQGVVLSLSGKTRVEGMKAGQIFWGMVQGAEELRELPLFQVDNPGIFPILNLPFETRGRYSYDDLLPGLSILSRIREVIEQREAEGSVDALERELIRLYRRGQLFQRLFAAGAVRSVAEREGGSSVQAGTSPLRLVPLKPRLSNSAGYEWVDPRSAVELLDGPLYLLPEGADREVSLDLIRGMADFQFSEMADLQRELLETMGLAGFWSRAQAELFHQRAGLVLWAIGFGSLALVGGILFERAGGGWWSAGSRGFLGSVRPAGSGASVWDIGSGASVRDIGSGGSVRDIGSRASVRDIGSGGSKQVPRVTKNLAQNWESGFLWLASLAGFVSLGLRIYITQRPPVTDLHSSALFIGIVALPVAALFARGRHRLVARIVTGFALAMLLLSRYLLGGGDDLAVVQAVLDTNLWLGVHVLTIALGYTAVLLGGLLGNAYTLTALIRPRSGRLLSSLYQTMFFSLLVGLVLSFFGTMLGGFWADQAWGRFWGWDPKENGALMIVLWTALVIHLRPAGFAGSFGTALAAGFGVAVTAFSWFGVNLIGEGLHSYGFSTRTLIPLIIGVGLEVIILVLGLLGAKRFRWAQFLPGEVQGRVLARQEISGGVYHVWVDLNAKDFRQIFSAYQPGQYVTLGMDRGGSIQRRVFSVSALKELSVRITLRVSGNRGVSHGLIRAPLGAKVSLIGTGGALRVPGDSSIPMFALVQGVGIGPVLPMMHHHLAAGGRVILLWAAGWTGDPEIAGLLDRYPKALELQSFQGERRLSQSVVTEIMVDQGIPGGGVVIVGSQDFVQGLEIPGAQTEMFITNRNSESRVGVGSDAESFEKSHVLRVVGGGGVRGKNQTIRVAPGQTLLSAMIEAGIEAPFACAGGQCGECRCRSIDGRVSMDHPNSLGRVSAGPGEDLLSCVAYPVEDMTLEIIPDGE